MDILTGLLEGSPMLALFVAIGLGYALGQVPVLGVMRHVPELTPEALQAEAARIDVTPLEPYFA